ncbi:MAG: leucine ABC transporter subunit substrate-binding protein LivK, partial [Aeromonas sobria]
TPIDTVMGNLNWAPNGDLKGFEFGVFQWHADGTSSQVK